MKRALLLLTIFGLAASPLMVPQAQAASVRHVAQHHKKHLKKHAAKKQSRRHGKRHKTAA